MRFKLPLVLLATLALLVTFVASAQAAPAYPRNEQLHWSATGALTAKWDIEGTDEDYMLAVLYKNGVQQEPLVERQCRGPCTAPYEATFTGLTESQSYVVKIVVHAHVGESESQWAEKEMPGGSTVLWNGDGVTKPLGEQWETQSDQLFCSQPITGNFPNTRLSTETDARFAVGTSVHFHMAAGDKGCFSGRTEILELGKAWPPLIEAGHEGWYAFQVLFPTDYPLNSENIYDGGVMQFHNYETHGTDGVPFGISVGRSCSPGSGKGTPHEGGPELGYMKAWIGVSESEGKYLRRCLSKEIHANQVYNVLIYAKFSKPTETTGIERIWLNGVKVDEYTGRFGLSTENVKSILHAGLYPDTNRAESPAMDLYEAGWTLANSRTAAEANAF